MDRLVGIDGTVSTATQEVADVPPALMREMKQIKRAHKIGRYDEGQSLAISVSVHIPIYACREIGGYPNENMPT